MMTGSNRPYYVNSSNIALQSGVKHDLTCNSSKLGFSDSTSMIIMLIYLDKPSILAIQTTVMNVVELQYPDVFVDFTLLFIQYNLISHSYSRLFSFTSHTITNIALVEERGRIKILLFCKEIIIH